VDRIGSQEEWIHEITQNENQEPKMKNDRCQMSNVKSAFSPLSGIQRSQTEVCATLARSSEGSGTFLAYAQKGISL